MAQKKFLDDSGLTRVWSRITTLLDTKEDVTTSITNAEIDVICGEGFVDADTLEPVEEMTASDVNAITTSSSSGS